MRIGVYLERERDMRTVVYLKRERERETKERQREI